MQTICISATQKQSTTVVFKLNLESCLCILRWKINKKLYINPFIVNGQWIHFCLQYMRRDHAGRLLSRHPIVTNFIIMFTRHYWQILLDNSWQGQTQTFCIVTYVCFIVRSCDANTLECLLIMKSKYYVVTFAAAEHSNSIDNVKCCSVGNT